MHISEAGLRLIMGFEGFSSKPYWDSYGGVYTRGFGETEGIRRDSPAITVAQGQANLEDRIERFYEPAIRALGLSLNQDQWDALCSFIWNLGTGILGAEHDIGRFLREHRWFDAANSMLEYDVAGGVVLAGLRSRREAERRLFLSAASAKPAYVPGDEARWCREWDRLHRGQVVRRRVLRRVMRRRESVLIRVARGQRDGWRVLNREARFHALKGRTG